MSRNERILINPGVEHWKEKTFEYSREGMENAVEYFRDLLFDGITPNVKWVQIQDKEEKSDE